VLALEMARLSGFYPITQLCARHGVHAVVAVTAAPTRRS
jgi:hypothetical protein